MKKYAGCAPVLIKVLQVYTLTVFNLLLFQKWARGATAKIFIAGIEFGYIVFHQRSTLEAKAASGCRVKLFLVDPCPDDQPNPVLRPLEETLSFRELGDLLQINLKRLSEWKLQLPPNIGKRVEIRVTKTTPTHVVTFVDQDLPSGKNNQHAPQNKHTTTTARAQLLAVSAG